MAPRSYAFVVLGTLVGVLCIAPAVAGGTAESPRRVERIYTIAGHGGSTTDAETPRDGMYGTDVEMSFPQDVAIAPDGSILYADPIERDTRRIGLDGRLSTVTRAGGETVDVLPDGELLVADGGQIFRGPMSGPMTLVGGQPLGPTGPNGDGGPAIDAQFSSIGAVVHEADGGMLVVEEEEDRVRRIRPDGIVETVAGTGETGFSGDGGRATSAKLHLSDFARADVAVLPDGGFLIADGGNDRVRKVGADGVITTVAGDGADRSRGDNGPAIRASIVWPSAVAVMPDEGFLVVDTLNRVRRVNSRGIITSIVGTGAYEPESPGVPIGDGGPTATAVASPFGGGLALTRDGFVFTDGARIRLVTSGAATFPAIAVTGISRGAGGRLTARFRTTLGGRVRATVRTEQGRREGQGATTIAGPGRGVVPINKRVDPGVYWLTLTADGKGDTAARTNIGIVVAPRLTRRVARVATAYATAEAPKGALYTTDVGACRRMTRHRIDCVGLRLVLDSRECVSNFAVTLRAGFTYARPYPCKRRFVQHPRWTGPSSPQAVMTTEPPGRP